MTQKVNHPEPTPISLTYIMGGNGASDHYRNYSLDIYEGDRFKQVGTIGNNKVVSTSVYDNTTIPMNCFTSKMYYVTSPKDPSQIVAIAFYSGRTHKIVKSIDLVYDKSGNLIPFKQVKRKGKIRKEGTHTHNWSGNKEKGKVGRKRHRRRKSWICIMSMKTHRIRMY